MELVASNRTPPPTGLTRSVARLQSGPTAKAPRVSPTTDNRTTQPTSPSTAAASFSARSWRRISVDAAGPPRWREAGLTSHHTIRGHLGMAWPAHPRRGRQETTTSRSRAPAASTVTDLQSAPASASDRGRLVAPAPAPFARTFSGLGRAASAALAGWRASSRAGHGHAHGAAARARSL